MMEYTALRMCQYENCMKKFFKHHNTEVLMYVVVVVVVVVTYSWKWTMRW